MRVVVGSSFDDRCFLWFFGVLLVVVVSDPFGR